MIKLQHTEVRYEVTDNCNSDCLMCPRAKHTRPHGVMDQADYEASIDEVVDMGAKQVVLTGFGEPLLDKNLEKKIAYAKSKSLRTYIITNAAALTNDRANGLILAGLDEMRVSFYGMESKSYNAVMRGLDYEKAKNNILRFLNLRRLLSSKVKVQLSFLVLPENKDDIDSFIEYWTQPAPVFYEYQTPRLVDYVEVWKPHNFGDGKDYRERASEKKTCGRPVSGPLQIQWNGEVIPCCYDYNNQIILGNAFKQPIEEILIGNKYNALRDAHRSGEFHKFPYCNQCDQLLPHDDALVFTNRHNLPASEAVKLSNTDLFNLVDGKKIDE